MDDSKYRSSFKLIRITTVPVSLRVLLTHQMRFMKEKGIDVLMVSSGGSEVEDLVEQEQSRHIEVLMTRKITPFRDVLALIKLAFLFRSEKPDIVHTHTPKAGLLGMVAAFFAGVPVRIHTVAGLPLMTTSGFKFRLLIKIEWLTYFFSTETWPNSTSLKDYIEKYIYGSHKKIKIIGHGSSNGIDLDYFNVKNIQGSEILKAKSEVNFKEENIYFLSVGRVVQDKGFSEIIKAFMSIQKKVNNLKLIIIGSFEDDLDPVPEEIKYEIQNNLNIHYLGSKKDVRQYFSFASLFIHASFREGFPNVLLQAGMLSCPIICSKISGNIDIVTDNKTGKYFEAGNYISLETALSDFLSDTSKFKRMADLLRKEIVRKYDRKFVHDQIYLEYKRLIKGKS